MRLPHGRVGTAVRVARGSVLVTREGDPEDHVLGAGEEIVLPARGLGVAWAFTEALGSVREASKASSRPRSDGTTRRHPAKAIPVPSSYGGPA